MAYRNQSIEMTSMQDTASNFEKGYGTQSVENLVNRFPRATIPPYDNSQPAFPTYHRKFANPAPLGLSAFALTTFFLSLVNVQARDVTTPNVVVGLALGYGGLVQLLAGMWEFAAGNTFGATAFSSYGAFWISFALIYWPSSGILDAFAGDAASQLSSSVGFYLAGWFIFTFICFLCTLRTSVGLIALFFMLDVTFFFLMVGAFKGDENINKIGGGCGLVTAAIAWYVALAGMLDGGSSIFKLPVGEISKKD